MTPHFNPQLCAFFAEMHERFFTPRIAISIRFDVAPALAALKRTKRSVSKRAKPRKRAVR